MCEGEGVVIVKVRMWLLCRCGLEVWHADDLLHLSVPFNHAILPPSNVAAVEFV